MSTFADMYNKINDDLNRVDLTTQVKREINRAIRKYGSMPFWFSGKSMNFATAKWQQYYDTFDGLPSDIRIVDYVRVNQSTGTINTDTGAADAYVIAPTPAITAYTDNDAYVFQATAANTGGSTLNVSGLGIRTITRPNGVALQVGDILTNQIISVVYNSATSTFYLRPLSGTYYPLYEREIDQIAKWNVNDNPGLPEDYAWFGFKLYFYPTFDNVYSVFIYYEKYYADLVNDSDNNDFTNNPEAENLIEQEVEYQVYNTIILDIEMAAKCKEARNEALKICKNITAQFIGAHGAIRPTTF